MLTETTRGAVTVFGLGRGVGHTFIYPVYAYLVADVLVDSGPPVTCTQFLDALAGRPVTTLVNTHPHEDHVGCNAALARDRDVRILAHPAALPVLADPAQLALRRYQKWAWGTPAPSDGAPLPAAVPAGSYTLEVVETPGHHPGHVCFHEPAEGWLFAGDLHVGDTRLVTQPFDDFARTLASLERVAELEPAVIFCAHQGVIPDARAALEAKIARMRAVQDQVTRLHAQGLPVKKITREVLGKEDFLAWLTRGHLAKRNTVKSILGLHPPVASRETE